MGRVLIIAGLILVVVGIAMVLGIKLPHWVGRLPGDIMINKENFRFYFPLSTCLLVSIILTVILKLFQK